MKGFFIEITNNLLDPKHQKAMKDSVWLFMWLLDKITSIDEAGIGKVLGGKPIKPEEVIKDLGISERTYWNWVKILLKTNYINSKRTSYGCVLTVNKARKRFGRSAKSGNQKCSSLHSEVQNPALTKKTLQDNTKTKQQVCFQLKDWNERQPSPITNFVPENIVNKYGPEKVEMAVKRWGQENGGFSKMLTELKEIN